MKQSEAGGGRSSSEPLIFGGQQGNAKLSKPPKVEGLHGRARNKLQKRGTAVLPMLTPYSPRLGFESQATTLYVLEHESYPYNTFPSEFLGVYSTIDSVTAGAIDHGAYTFSREGLLDGSEYLSPNGRIKIHTQPVLRSGTEAAVPLRGQSMIENPSDSHKQPIRSDIPHPDSRSNTLSCAVPHSRAAHSTTSLKLANKSKETVFLGLRQGPTEAHCLGVFASPSLAWGTCLKNKASCAMAGMLSEESREVDASGLPRTSGRLHGCGLHTWVVVAKEVDASAR
ncbi:hypothetical protein E8E13_000817 [Curvularia kusanoi]|uniref:Uncharacterized protein n=1 Tax=Curvularia kusanoi TaxID=90978 RepID=A0A9P4W8G2_CURKU|nr:hypothetical protein E8E13_000817 [Curvularia kusanoi]